MTSSSNWSRTFSFMSPLNLLHPPPISVAAHRSLFLGRSPGAGEHLFGTCIASAARVLPRGVFLSAAASALPPVKVLSFIASGSPSSEHLFGISAAVQELNRKHGGLHGRPVVLEIQNGDNITDMFTAVAAPGVLGVVHPDVNISANAFGLALARRVPVVGLLVLLGPGYGKGFEPLIHVRPDYNTEVSHILNVGANSKTQCNRWFIVHSPDFGVPESAAVMANQIRALGFPDPYVFSLNVSEPERPAFLRAKLRRIMKGEIPDCYAILEATEINYVLVREVTNNATLFGKDSTFFFTSSYVAADVWDVTGVPHEGFANMFNSRVFPHPEDNAFDIVKNFHSAAADVVANRSVFAPGSYPNLTTVPPVSRQHSTYVFEAYVSTRLLLEAALRAQASTITYTDVLTQIYKTRLFTLDDFVLGPYADGCTGSQSVKAAPCDCNSGARHVFLVGVNGTTGEAYPIHNDPSRHEQNIADIDFPPEACTLPASVVYRSVHSAIFAAPTTTSAAATASMRAAWRSSLKSKKSPSVNGKQTPAADVASNAHVNSVTENSAALAAVAKKMHSALSDSMFRGRALTTGASTVRTTPVMVTLPSTSPTIAESKEVLDSAEYRYRVASVLLPQMTLSVLEQGRSSIIGQSTASPSTLGSTSTSTSGSTDNGTSIGLVIAPMKLRWDDVVPAEAPPMTRWYEHVIYFWPAISELVHTAASYAAEKRAPIVAAVDNDLLSDAVVKSVNTFELQPLSVAVLPASNAAAASGVEAPSVSAVTAAKLWLSEQFAKLAVLPPIDHQSSQASHSFSTAASATALNENVKSELRGVLIVASQHRAVIAAVTAVVPPAGVHVIVCTSETLLELSLTSHPPPAGVASLTPVEVPTSSPASSTPTTPQSTTSPPTTPNSVNGSVAFVASLPTYGGVGAATAFGNVIGELAAAFTKIGPTTEARLAAMYSAGRLSANTVTLSPLSRAECTAALLASRTPCQANRGLARFRIVPLSEALTNPNMTAPTSSLTPAPPSSSTPSSSSSSMGSGEFTTLHDVQFPTGRVEYLPLPSGASSSSRATLYIVIGSCTGGVVGVVIAAVLVYFFCLHTPRRSTKTAPKDPSVPFAIAFTDIQASTLLWAHAPMHMGDALDLHNKIIRSEIVKNNGYEVKTIGDSFMVAFKEASDAVGFALSVQQSLFSADWGTTLFDRTYEQVTLDAAPDLPFDQSSWNGLRVRVGVHYGRSSIRFEETTHGYDYYGTVVNTAARVEGVGHGGQILVTHDALNAATDDGKTSLKVQCCGNVVEVISDQRGGSTHRQLESESTKVNANDNASGSCRMTAIGPPESVHKTTHENGAGSSEKMCSAASCVMNALGPQPLRGLEEPPHLTQLVLGNMLGRVFPPLRLDVEVTLDHGESSDPDDLHDDSFRNESGLGGGVSGSGKEKETPRRNDKDGGTTSDVPSLTNENDPRPADHRNRVPHENSPHHSPGRGAGNGSLHIDVNGSGPESDPEEEARGPDGVAMAFNPTVHPLTHSQLHLRSNSHSQSQEMQLQTLVDHSSSPTPAGGASRSDSRCDHRHNSQSLGSGGGGGGGGPHHVKNGSLLSLTTPKVQQRSDGHFNSGGPRHSDNSGGDGDSRSRSMSKSAGSLPLFVKPSNKRPSGGFSKSTTAQSRSDDTNSVSSLLSGSTLRDSAAAAVARTGTASKATAAQLAFHFQIIAALFSTSPAAFRTSTLQSCAVRWRVAHDHPAAVRSFLKRAAVLGNAATVAEATETVLLLRLVDRALAVTQADGSAPTVGGRVSVSRGRSVTVVQAAPRTDDDEGGDEDTASRRSVSVQEHGLPDEQ